MTPTGTMHGRGVIMVVPYPPGESGRGISAVAGTLLKTPGLGEFDIRWVATTHPGGLTTKLAGAVSGGFRYLALLSSGAMRVVHIHSGSFHSFGRKGVYALLALAFGKRVILHVHGGGFRNYYERSPAFWRSFVRFMLRRSDAVVALSPTWGEYLREIEPRSEVLVLPNPVDMCAPPGVPAAGPASVPRVLFLGALQKGKGIFDLLDAVPSVVRSVPDVQFLLCGTGMRDECRARAQALGIADHVEFPGYVTGGAKQKALIGSTLFVLPSYAEGLPVSLIEAMASGLPVITTPVGGIPDYVEDGTNGYLVTPGDVGALSDRIIRLLGDEAARERMGKANRKLARATFDAPSIATALRDLYQRMLA